MTALQLATVVVDAARFYLAAGLVFAMVFTTLLLPRLDPSAKGSTWAFRLVIVPGCALLWPLLLLRVIRGSGRPIERTPHRLPVLQSQCGGRS